MRDRSFRNLATTLATAAALCPALWSGALPAAAESRAAAERPRVVPAQSLNVRVSDTTGNPRLDAIMRREIPRLEKEFGVNPAVFIYDDGNAPNAMATGRRRVAHRTGTVYFGRTLMVRELFEGPYRAISVVGIMAHEYAHIVQIHRRDLSFRIVQLELQADCMAGWYLRRTRGRSLDIQPFAQSLFDKGDYAYWNRNHHGTPHQRMRAMVAGAHASDLNLDSAYDYCFTVAERVPQ